MCTVCTGRTTSSGSGVADFDQDLARDFGVCGDGEGLVNILDRQHVSDHLLDLGVLVEQRDGGVDLGVEAEGASQLDLLGDQGCQVDRSRLVGQIADLDDDAGRTGGKQQAVECLRYSGALQRYV